MVMSRKICRKEATMGTAGAKPKSIDEYIASFSPEVQVILKKIRLTIGKAAPDAKEAISYGMPAYTLGGVLVYFAAFKKHIGFYPPVRGDAELKEALSIYAGEKGSLRFPLDQPIPYGLIERIVKLRVKQMSSKALGRSYPFVLGGTKSGGKAAPSPKK
jgi:uncharacterized protein YdhG (YjbR/CyaY superfamily)